MQNHLSTNHIEKERYLSLDFARIMAIFFMIQGHTIGSIVNINEINSLGFLAEVWIQIRSVTSATFLIISGIVNFVGLKRDFQGNVDNNQLKKRVKRAFLLILIDYILIFPVTNLSNLSNLTSTQWFNFFKIGTLNIVGVSLLFLVILMKLTKSNKSLALSSLYISITLIFLTPLFHWIDWFKYLHPYFAHLLSQSGGSFFSFPSHTPFILVGVYIGYNYVLKSKNILKYIFLTGIIITILGESFNKALEYYFGYYSNNSSPFFIIYKIGISIILISFYFKISEYLTSVKGLVYNLSSKNLFTYVVHIIIVFGTPWSLGLIYYQSNIGLINGILLTFLITAICFIITYLYSSLNYKYKELNKYVFYFFLMIVLILGMTLNEKIQIF